jgi:hypothetical protein
MTFVEFTNCSYGIYWADREKGNQRIRFEAREFAALDHVNDVIMNIVDFLEIVVEHHSVVSNQSMVFAIPLLCGLWLSFTNSSSCRRPIRTVGTGKWKTSTGRWHVYRRLDEYK